MISSNLKYLTIRHKDQKPEKYDKQATSKMQSNAKLYNKIMAEGIPERWTNTINMQNEFENAQAKGWQVNMRWGKSDHLAAIGMESVGAYVMQDVKKGEVLRKGEEGKNLIIATKMEDFPKLSPV